MLQVLDYLYANQSLAYKKAKAKVKVEPWVRDWFIRMPDL